eukprot:scaffold57513_cov20-Tisochrysis_lutea.AAC.3
MHACACLCTVCPRPSEYMHAISQSSVSDGCGQAPWMRHFVSSLPSGSLCFSCLLIGKECPSWIVVCTPDALLRLRTGVLHGAACVGASRHPASRHPSFPACSDYNALQARLGAISRPSALKTGGQGIPRNECKDWSPNHANASAGNARIIALPLYRTVFTRMDGVQYTGGFKKNCDGSGLWVATVASAASLCVWRSWGACYWRP